MATLGDIMVAAAINILTATFFFVAFAVLRLQPFNDRVYYPKWYIKGLRSSPVNSGALTKYVNLDWRSYVRFLSWVPESLQMPERELIEHAGLDSAVYLRIYLLGLKILVPMTVLACAIFVPVNYTDDGLAILSACDDDFFYSNIDKLSISNISEGSLRIWVHIIMAYVFTIWTCYALKREYETVAEIRLQFIASDKRRPDQFTVLVRNVPPDPHESVSESVEHFFLVTQPDQYLTHQVVYNANKLAKLVELKKIKENWLDYYQLKHLRNPSRRPTSKTGFLGLCGETVDAIYYKTAEIEMLSREIEEERERVRTDPTCVMPAAFVSFKTRFTAAVCAQTQQSRNPTLWLTDWAPEPRDVYWPNLAIPYVSLTIRRLIVTVAFFFLTFFFMIPITLVQSLANIDAIVTIAPFLKPLIELKSVNAIIQGFLPGLALKIFLLVLPMILMLMSKFEGFISISFLERRSALRCYSFNFINVFLVSVIAGSALEELEIVLHQSPSEIPKTIGSAISMNATFFMSYVMVDGWTGVAGEILRFKPLIKYHLTDFFLVKTENDREEAMDPGSICFDEGEPRIQLYILLGLVYAVVTPAFLPFILVFFCLAFVVHRHQIINVYNQEYESSAAFWPDVHGRIVYALIFSHIVLIGLIGTKGDETAATSLIALPLLTFFFHRFCKGRYEPAFIRYPLQEAMVKDTLEQTREPNLNLKGYLENAYVHPIFKEGDEDEGFSVKSLDETVTVPTLRRSRPSISLANP